MTCADDRFGTRIEMGGEEEEWLPLRAAEATVIADQLLERRYLTGHRVESAHHDDVRHIGKSGRTEQMASPVRTVRLQRVVSFDLAVA